VPLLRLEDMKTKELPIWRKTRESEKGGTALQKLWSHRNGSRVAGTASRMGSGDEERSDRRARWRRKRRL